MSDSFASNHRPHGTILTIHGACEHSGRYAEWVTSANADGWVVLTPDLPGHGENQTHLRTHLNSPDEYLVFLADYLNSIEITPPLIIMGHSLGGLLACRLVQEWHQLELKAKPRTICSPVGLVMLSPLLAVAHAVPVWKYLLGKICFYIYPRLRFQTEITGVELTSDLEKVKAWEQDPLIIHSVTAGWFFHLQELIKRGNLEVNNITLPVLILQSGDDHVVNPQAAKEYFLRIPSTNKTFELLDQRKHELLNETDRQETMIKVLQWINNLTV